MYKEPINTYKKTTFFHLFQINSFAAVIFFLNIKWPIEKNVVRNTTLFQ